MSLVIWCEVSCSRPLPRFFIICPWGDPLRKKSLKYVYIYIYIIFFFLCLGTCDLQWPPPPTPPEQPPTPIKNNISLCVHRNFPRTLPPPRTLLDAPPPTFLFLIFMQRFLPPPRLQNSFFSGMRGYLLPLFPFPPGFSFHFFSVFLL